MIGQIFLAFAHALCVSVVLGTAAAGAGDAPGAVGIQGSLESVRAGVAVADVSAPAGGGPVGAGSCPGTGDCCVANGTPGCSDVTCCEDVCFFDPFCCTTTWDSVCAGEAVQIGCCAGGTCPGTGDCCVANGTPGCSDATCCEAVCACDPFCCDNVWDTSCAENGFMGNGCGAALLCDCGGPPNDNCADAEPVGEGTFPFDTTGATTDGPLLPSSCNEGSGLSFTADIWYLYTSSCAGSATVSLCNSGFDTRLAVYGDGSCPGALVACNDDACGVGGFRSELTFDVVTGNSYLIRVGGFSGSGTGTMTISCGGGCAPACSKLNVECLNPSPAYDNRRPVARLTREIAPGVFVPHCTGWMIGSPDCMLTNQHCVAGIDVTTLRAEFDYECDACENGTCRTPVFFDVEGLIHSSVGLDYALLDLAGDPAASFGALTLDCAPVEVGGGIYEIHHAEGDKKGYDEGAILSVSEPGVCLPGTDIEVAVSVIASQGASGSPIFGMNTHAVEAICHCGPPCSDGWGVPMSAILPDARPHIEAHGCTVKLFGACNCPGDQGCCWANGSSGCDDASCCTQVCTLDPSCCNDGWDAACVGLAESVCGSACDCGAFGDFDGDGDLDLNDYVELFGCVAGPNGTPPDGSCVCGDADGDGDVDLLDLGAFAATAGGG